MPVGHYITLFTDRSRFSDEFRRPRIRLQVICYARGATVKLDSDNKEVTASAVECCALRVGG